MINLDLANIDEEIKKRGLDDGRAARVKTVFLKNLSEKAHIFYGGKMQTVPKAGVFGFNWFNVWYTLGVSRVSTLIRDNNDAVYDLSNKGNYVAVVSDSTRVLGDGDCTPPGGLGVDEMTIAAAKSLAKYAEDRGITPDNIIATMEEPGVFPYEAADVAMQAIKEGLAKVEMSREEVLRKAQQDITYSRNLVDSMEKEGYIKKPPVEMINIAFEEAIQSI